ncbi:uncharacterized protein B0T15DRAFT_418913 [Chaetomium strumarium]|uniref:Glycosyl transferase CAP10 domain-containing protein n=1 Tax=Chaetomium strumarium TaxID=1170767 RepID=A0AAJ0GRM8_9PEZI|nr:hypothetical protein B0T15DRAFT_418913 [Chaetomium strumarium]
MHNPRCDSFAAAVDPLVGAAGAAALCAVLVQRLPTTTTSSSNQSGEVASEVVCWALLGAAKRWDLLGFGAAGSGASLPGAPATSSSSGGGVGGGAKRPRPGWSLWAVAAAVAAACCYRAEVGMLWSVPALTPLLLAADKQLRPELRTWKALELPALFYLFGTVSGTAIVGLLVVLALPGWTIWELALSTLPVAALCAAYAAFIPRTVESRFLPYLDVDEDILQLSHRVVVISVAALSVQIISFGVPGLIDLAVPTILLGLAKASAWYFTIQTARSTSWCIAGAIGAFALVASRDPFIQLSESQAISPVLASTLALGQFVAILPRQLRGRPILWALILISLGPYLANYMAITVAESSVVRLQEHPVETLIRNAQADFEQMLQRQSKTYPDAVHEYQRRYGVEPPPGFQAWYEFAAANQSPIIDDFDTIYLSVSPFWSISGREMLQIIDDAHNTPDIDLWLCSFSGDTAETRCTHPRRGSDRHIGDLFNTLLGDVRGVLPNAKFLVNHLDEPRVLIPPASLKKNPREFKVSDLSERPTWKAVTKYCGLQAQQLRDLSPYTDTEGQRPAVDTHGLPLVTNRSTVLNLCQHPEYAGTHGLFQAPPSFRLIEGRVPVLSTGRPSTMSDILFPAPAYLVEPEFRYNASADIPWSQKANHLYWAGSTTGAVSSTHNSWRHFHRQRFISLAQNLDPPAEGHTYLREVPPSSSSSSSPSSSPPSSTTTNHTPSITPIHSRFLNSRLYDVHPTRIFQCSHPLPCREQASHFRHIAWQDRDAALRARLVFDLDGNGISGRFHKLLASGSLVLKQTLLREWHDDRLVPWAHYIPVSVGTMAEVPELVQWFLESDRGKGKAREVAEGGKEWFARAMREVDVKIYLWRLMLELARVVDEGREALAEVVVE